MTQLFRDYRNFRILADQPPWLAFQMPSQQPSAGE
jgi:hypothetical protein